MSVKDIYMKIRLSTLGYYDSNKNTCFVDPKKVLKKHSGKIDEGYDLVIPEDIQRYNSKLKKPVKFVFQTERFEDLVDVKFTGEIEFYNCIFSGRNIKIKPISKSVAEKLYLKNCIFNAKKVEFSVDNILLYRNYYNITKFNINTINLDARDEKIENINTTINANIGYNSRYLKLSNCNYKVMKLEIENTKSKNNYMLIENSEVNTNNLSINDRHNFYIKNSNISASNCNIISKNFTIDDNSSFNGNNLDIIVSKNMYKGIDRDNINFNNINKSGEVFQEGSNTTLSSEIKEMHDKVFVKKLR